MGKGKKKNNNKTVFFDGIVMEDAYFSLRVLYQLSDSYTQVLKERKGKKKKLKLMYLHILAYTCILSSYLTYLWP